MIYPSADKLETWGSKYALVTLAAKRAKQIKSGAPPLIDTDSRNPLTIALEEIAAGRITCEVPDVDAVPGISMEAEVAELLAIPEDYDDEAAVLTADTAPVHEEEAEASYDEEEIEEEEEEEEDHPLWIEEAEDEVEEEVGLSPVDDEEEAIPAVEVVDVEAVDEDIEVKPRGRRKKAAVDADIEDVDVDVDMDVDVDLDSIDDIELDADTEDAEPSDEEEV
jgi:DNA-directed RNA polymerase subunit omega